MGVQDQVPELDAKTALDYLFGENVGNNFTEAVLEVYDTSFYGKIHANTQQYLRWSLGYCLHQEMTAKLHEFLQDNEDIAEFAHWFEFQRALEEDEDYRQSAVFNAAGTRMHSTSFPAVRRDIILGRLNMARDLFLCQGELDPTYTKFWTYLETARVAMFNFFNPAPGREPVLPVFAVNGFSAPVEDAVVFESLVLDCLRYIAGGDRWQAPTLYGVNDADMRAFGYMLKVCDERINLIVEGNRHKNDCKEASLLADAAEGNWDERGETRYIGRDTEEVTWDSPVVEVFEFEIDEEYYIAFEDLELPDGSIPVFEIGSEDETIGLYHPHAGMALSCRSCDINWDHDHGGAWRNQNGRYRESGHSLSEMTIMRVDDAEYYWSNDGENADREFDIKEFVEESAANGCHHVLITDEDTLLCPHCAAELSFYGDIHEH
jgi:hypothetical protein